MRLSLCVYWGCKRIGAGRLFLKKEKYKMADSNGPWGTKQEKEYLRKLIGVNRVYPRKDDKGRPKYTRKEQLV